jgi:hypothetical protein
VTPLRWRGAIGAGSRMVEGWLPLRAAARAHGMTVPELRDAIRAGEIRARTIVPRVAMLVEAPR